MVQSCMNTRNNTELLKWLGASEQQRLLPLYRLLLAVFFFFFFLTLLLSSFWTSRGHRCRPFLPPGSYLQFLSRIGFSSPAARRFFIERCY